MSVIKRAEQVLNLEELVEAGNALEQILIEFCELQNAMRIIPALEKWRTAVRRLRRYSELGEEEDGDGNYRC